MNWNYNIKIFILKIYLKIYLINTLYLSFTLKTKRDENLMIFKNHDLIVFSISIPCRIIF